MTDNTKIEISSRLPTLRSRWWVVVLGLSLMANLLIVGAVIGHRYWDGGGDRRNNFVQLVPGKFFGDLPGGRRRELMQFLHGQGDDFKSLRAETRATALKLADALDHYDAVNVKTVIDNFTTGSESLAARGGAVVVDLIAKLTPDERAQLAAAIRDRDNRRPRD
jgi:uncharacterized membrane protein